ncbi:MAG: LysR family transcriptional regulator [Rhizobiales bacterium]|nr:LysR family transcriptional regulator [Hyphomicrobiales bacterium]
MTNIRKPFMWDDVRLVKAIADGAGLQSAAAALGVNHSTVFRRLAAIEATLGASLFERRRSGYVPTPAGQEMIALAERIEADLTASTRKLAGWSQAPAGELRVTTSDALHARLLMPLFLSFRAKCPDVQLDLVLGNRTPDLARRDADVAVQAVDAPPPELVGRRIARVAWALYGRVADAAPVSANDAAPAQRPWVMLSEDGGAPPAVQATLRQVPAGHVACTVNSVLGLAEAIEAGLGIGYLPSYVGDASPLLRRLAPPVPDHAADLWLLTHPDLKQSARVRVFLDFLAVRLTQLRPLIEGSEPGLARSAPPSTRASLGMPGAPAENDDALARKVGLHQSK